MQALKSQMCISNLRRNSSARRALKYYVLYMNGDLKVVPKQTIKTLVKRHRFKKGTKVEDIERRALFVTK